MVNMGKFGILQCTVCLSLQSQMEIDTVHISFRNLILGVTADDFAFIAGIRQFPVTFRKIGVPGISQIGSDPDGPQRLCGGAVSVVAVFGLIVAEGDVVGVVVTVLDGGCAQIFQVVDT